MKYEKSSSIPNRTMETLGEFFQQARERQGLSLDQVASQTRIQARHLQALEEEDFANLPAKVFTKGFVRSYARSLGLDENEALQLFLVSSGSFYENIQQEQQKVQIKLETVQRSRFNWNVVLVLFLVIGGALYFLLPEQQNIPNTPPPIEPQASLPIESRDSNQEFKHALPETSASASFEAPVTQSEPPPSPPSFNSPPAEISKSQNITPSLPISSHTETAGGRGEKLVLEIEATQLTWVVVQSDDQAPHEALLQPGQRVTWKAKNKYLLTLGNAAGVVIRLNGESQGPFGKPGEVVRNILLKS